MTMNKTTILLLLLFLLSPVLYAQTYTGKVVKENGEGIAKANVVARTVEKKIAAYAVTDSKGSFRMAIPEGKKAATVTVTFMGYEKKVIPAEQMADGMKIVMTEGMMELKTVSVRPAMVRENGDTLTYSVNKFKHFQDRSIADVIKKMPGLEVLSNGTVLYQGETISEFKIEGLNLMGGQYGIASNNIPADKVRSVQVLRNHQPIKSLRGIKFNDKAALNIVLNDDAKAVWVATAKLSGGMSAPQEGSAEMLYDPRVMAMRFNKTFQTLMMYKGNNIGDDIGGEVRYALSRKRDTKPYGGILNMPGISVHELEQRQYTFNDSHLFAGNWLWKLNKDSQLRLQGNALLEKDKISRETSTTYLNVEGMPVIIEDQNTENKRREVKGEITYEYNSDKTYIRSNTRGYADWNEGSGLISVNGRETRQAVKPHKRFVSEDLEYSHTTKKGNVVNIASLTQYNYQPGQLLTIGDNTQRVTLQYFNTENYTKFGLKLGKLYLDNTAGVIYDRQQITASLDTIPNAPETENTYQATTVYWTPSLKLNLKDHYLTFSSAVKYLHHTYKQSKSDNVWAEPHVTWKWQMTSLSELNMNAGLSASPRSAAALYDTPIFTSYRSQRQNRGETDITYRQSAGMSYRFIHPFKGIFFIIMPSIMRTSGNMMYASTIKDDVYISVATDKEYSMTSLMLNTEFSKSFYWAMSNITIKGNAMKSDYPMLVGKDINDCEMLTYGCELSASMKPIQQLSIEGRTKFNVSKQENKDNTALNTSAVKTWQHKLSVYIFPYKNWLIGLKNTIFHSNNENSPTNSFLDVSVSYKAKRWELELKANNIIGTSVYEREYISTTVQSFAATRLRPREILLAYSVDL